eukprot:s359_g20.t1
MKFFYHLARRLKEGCSYTGLKVTSGRMMHEYAGVNMEGTRIVQGFQARRLDSAHVGHTPNSKISPSTACSRHFGHAQVDSQLRVQCRDSQAAVAERSQGKAVGKCVSEDSNLSLNDVSWQAISFSEAFFTHSFNLL